MKRFRVILAIGAVLVWAAVFPLGCTGYEPLVATTNPISVYVDKDVVTYGDTLTIFIENTGDDAISGGPGFRIADSARETVFAPAFPPLLRRFEPGEKVTYRWTPVRYPPDDGNWLEGELLPGDYYAEGGWGCPTDVMYTDSAEFTLVEESALDEFTAP